MQTPVLRRHITMPIRRLVISTALIMLVCTPGVILAAGGGSFDWRMFRRESQSDRGSTMQMQGMMQQMSGMLEHMAAHMQAGALTPEHAKQMSELMGQIAVMTEHLAWMMGGGTGAVSGQATEMTGPNMPQQMATMMERMTDLHKRMMSLVTAPQPAKK